MYSDLLEGSVHRKDVQEIKEMLEEEKEKGNRFVCFPGNSQGLKKEEFTGFKSALDAQEHAFETTSRGNKHLVRSIVAVDNELNRVLENNKGQQQDQSTGLERKDNRSRDQEWLR